MMNGSQLLLLASAALSAALVSFAATPYARAIAVPLGALDIPRDDRRMHTKPIPRSGGIALFASFFIAFFLFCAPDGRVTAWIGGGTILFAAGLLDDIHPLRPMQKLFCQALAALPPVLNGFAIDRIGFLGLPTLDTGRMAPALGFLWLLVLINAQNVIDGLDALAVGVCLIQGGALTLMALAAEDGFCATGGAILVGMCYGFRPFNGHPAKLFMGDCGAMLQGYLLALLSGELLFVRFPDRAATVALLLHLYPLTDLTLAVLRRLARRTSPFTADRAHLHHRLIDRGLDHAAASRLLRFLTLLTALAALGLAPGVSR